MRYRLNAVTVWTLISANSTLKTNLMGMVSIISMQTIVRIKGNSSMANKKVEAFSTPTIEKYTRVNGKTGRKMVLVDMYTI